MNKRKKKYTYLETKDETKITQNKEPKIKKNGKIKRLKMTLEKKILAIVSWEKQKIKRGAVVEKRPN